MIRALAALPLLIGQLGAGKSALARAVTRRWGDRLELAGIG